MSAQVLLLIYNSTYIYIKEIHLEFVIGRENN